jgi:hypothetical protein
MYLVKKGVVNWLYARPRLKKDRIKKGLDRTKEAGNTDEALVPLSGVMSAETLAIEKEPLSSFVCSARAQLYGSHCTAVADDWQAVLKLSSVVMPSEAAQPH